MSDDIGVAWIGQIAPLALLVAVVVALLWLRKPIKDLAGRATKIGIAGIIEVSAEPLKDAPSGESVSERDVRTVDLRVQRNREQLARTRLLWVDDMPENNRVERAYLHDVGVAITVATSTEEALAQLDRVDPTVVVTDIARPESPTAGLELAQTLSRSRPPLPVIGYVRRLEPGTPVGFFGITSRPDELVHLVLDVAERRG